MRLSNENSETEVRIAKSRIELREEFSDFGTPENGMIHTIQDQVNPDHSETYRYDNLYRLASAETSVWSLSWVYDRYGNRLSQSGSGGVPTETLTISTTTNRVSGWTYDAAGSVTNDGTHTYAYDAENRLISVDAGATATYGYGPNGERVWKIAGGVTTYYFWGIVERVTASFGARYPVQSLWRRPDVIPCLSQAVSA